MVAKLRWRSCSQSIRNATCCFMAPTRSTDSNWITASLQVFHIWFSHFQVNCHFDGLRNCVIITICNNCIISASISGGINKKSPLLNCSFSVSTGILSQRMFVMLPCGGVGVRENIQSQVDNSPKALHEMDLKQSLLLMKDNIVSKRRQGTQERMTTETGY